MKYLNLRLKTWYKRGKTEHHVVFPPHVETFLPAASRLKKVIRHTSPNYFFTQPKKSESSKLRLYQVTLM